MHCNLRIRKVHYRDHNNQALDPTLSLLNPVQKHIVMRFNSILTLYFQRKFFMRSHRPSYACYMSRPQQPTDFTAQRDQIVPHPRILFSLLDPCVLIIRLINGRKLHNMESSILLSK